MILVAALAGYLIGSAPTAGYLALLKGVDLRTEGSGNPGAHNALRTVGPGLAAAVLFVEAVKGYGAVWLGVRLFGDPGAVAAGIGAVTGNVYNVWYRFQGGKGLGISLGVLSAAWPTVVLPILGVIAVVVTITRSAGLASLAAMTALVGASFLWSAQAWVTGGVEPGIQLVVLSLGMSLVMMWRHIRDSPLTPAWRASRRTPA